MLKSRPVTKFWRRLPISTYWTTNYDTLIERALEQAGKRPDIKYNIEQLALTLPRRDCVVYKMHGDISNPGQTVLIKDDYEKYFLTNQAFITALTGDLISQTFLFIGFSFSDPNIDYVLGRIRASYVKNMRTHYCFIKRLNETDFTEFGHPRLQTPAAGFVYRRPEALQYPARAVGQLSPDLRGPGAISSAFTKPNPSSFPGPRTNGAHGRPIVLARSFAG